jgi:HEAT repeat protein
MTDTLRITAAALGAAALLAVDASAQVAPRVNAVRDGDVRMTFAARPGVCGWGEGNVRVISANRRSNDDWEATCEPGPVRVVLTRRDGRTVELDTYIGGRWRDRSGITDLGRVSAVSASAYFMEVAETAEGDIAKDAILPAAVADSVVAWPRLLRLARQSGRPTEVRKSAVFWVGQTDDEQAADGLWELIRADGPTEIREHAVFALSQHESDRVPDRLRQLAVDPDMAPDVRERAIFWLGQRDDAGSITELDQLYSRLDDTRLKERVIFAISQGRDDDRAQWLLRVAESSGESVDLRAKAIFWLGQRRDASTVEVLSRLYDRIDNPTLKEKIIFGMSQGNDDRRVEWLATVAESDDEPVDLRGKAIFWLGQAGGSADRLYDLYDRLESQSLREKLIFAYSQRRDERALDVLMTIARNDQDRELRKKAIFWLGQSRDPRAAEFLEELIIR